MRLDQLLVERGLSATRSQARDAILRGAVRVAGVTARRPGENVAEDVDVSADPAPYASRAAHKLVHALDHFRIDPAGAAALDVGASTGGFTDVLLRRGAARVAALDVGRGQLRPELADDTRVVVLDGINARHVTSADLPFRPDLVVADVSFISLRLVLPPVLSAAAKRARVVALVKPQFEVGRAALGKGGIVRDETAAHAAVGAVERVVAAAGFRLLGRTASPIAGATGNREWLIAAHRR